MNPFHPLLLILKFLTKFQDEKSHNFQLGNFQIRLMYHVAVTKAEKDWSRLVRSWDFNLLSVQKLKGAIVDYII